MRLVHLSLLALDASRDAGRRGHARRGHPRPERDPRLGGAGRILPRRALLRRRDRARPRADGGALRPRAGAIPRRRRRPLLPAAHGSCGRCRDASGLRARHDAAHPARGRSRHPEARAAARRRFHAARSARRGLGRQGPVGRPRRLRRHRRGPQGHGARAAPDAASSRSARCRSQTGSSSSPTRSAGRKLPAPAPAGAIPAGRSSPADRAATGSSASCRGRRARSSRATARPAAASPP